MLSVSASMISLLLLQLIAFSSESKACYGRAHKKEIFTQQPSTVTNEIREDGSDENGLPLPAKNNLSAQRDDSTTPKYVFTSKIVIANNLSNSGDYSRLQKSLFLSQARLVQKDVPNSARQVKFHLDKIQNGSRDKFQINTDNIVHDQPKAYSTVKNSGDKVYLKSDTSGKTTTSGIMISYGHNDYFHATFKRRYLRSSPVDLLMATPDKKSAMNYSLHDQMNTTSLGNNSNKNLGTDDNKGNVSSSCGDDGNSGIEMEEENGTVSSMNSNSVDRSNGSILEFKFTSSTDKADFSNGTGRWNSIVLNFNSKYPVGLWKSVGLYSDSYIESINPHWLSFDPPSVSTHVVLAILYAIVMAIGCAGNLLVIFMFIR